MKTIAVLCTLVFNGGVAVAENEMPYSKVASAFSLEELEKIQQNAGELAVLQRACEIEVTEKRMPLTCYQYERLAAKTGVGVKTKVDEESCILAAHSADNLTGEGAEALPPKCRQAFLDKVSINRYRKGIRSR